MNIKKKLVDINSAINNSLQNPIVDDLYSFTIINEILKKGSYLPFTEKSFRPFCLAYILNEIIINQRRNIIEFGCGVSTILIARFLKLEGLNVRFTSVEDNEGWFEFIKQRLTKEGLEKTITLIHAPVTQINSNSFKTSWYSPEVVADGLKTKEDKYDFIIVDGPASYSKEIQYNRYFALPFLKDLLSDRCVILLDDAHRKGEREVLAKWANEFNIAFSIYSKTLAVGYKGSYFIANPTPHEPVSV
jgi:predicted O-methyltransferase YrrM